MRNKIEQFFAQPEWFQDTWNRVVHVISRMRGDRVSLYQAAREFDVSPREVIKLGGAALRKTADGRYVAKQNDTLLRVLSVPDRRGLREVAFDDSREASFVGKYWDAVGLYIQTGNTSGLRTLRRRSVWDANGKRVELLTDLDELDRLASAGVLSFESIYARSA